MSGWFKTRVRWRALLDPNTSFRQRCASALTHPATVVALAVLLLNDVLFKALWPGSWWTGKLSDLAWMVFAPPLLAFLMSFLTRGNSRTEKASWVAAYIGLPLLYAAFNTFEPAHYWILRGLSIASGGTAGSPMDVTDSLVIPFGMGVAVWVWRQRVAGPATQRLRWGLLVAGVAALASVASSEEGPDYGITRLGVTEGATVHADAGHSAQFQSVDGGLNWSEKSGDPGGIVWGGDSASTPRGRYVIEGAAIRRLDSDGRSEHAYSAAYLRKPGNVWVQEFATSVARPRRIATRPREIVYDPRSGNLIVAMGIQGVVVGTPDGRWERVAVGWYSPTDFSFTAKTRLLLSRLDFWVLAVTLSIAMAGIGLTVLGIDANDPEPSVRIRRKGVVLPAIATAVIVLGLILIVFPDGRRLVLGPIGLLGLFALAPFLVGIAIWEMALGREIGWGLALWIGFLAVFGSCIMLLMFGDTDRDANFHTIFFSVISAPSFILGTAAMAISRTRPKYWPTIGGALVGMISLVILAFMLWLHLGIALALAKVSALVLTALVAFLLAGHIKRKTVRPDP